MAKIRNNPKIAQINALKFVTRSTPSEHKDNTPKINASFLSEK